MNFWIAKLAMHDVYLYKMCNQPEFNYLDSLIICDVDCHHKLFVWQLFSQIIPILP